MTAERNGPKDAAPLGRKADGTPIADADVEAMADEAERGYDVDALLARRVPGEEQRRKDAPMLTPLELDAILGMTAATLDLSRLEGTLVAVEGRLRGMLIPAFQIDVEAAVVRPLVAELNRDFLDAKNDPWGAGAWWLTPSETLPEAMSPADAVVAGGHDDLLRQIAAEVAADWEPSVLPLTGGLTLDEARTRVTAYHFAKEALSDGELELLTLAEGLLRLLDIRAGGTAR